MKSLPFSPRRVLLIAQDTLVEAARQRVFAGFLLPALGFVLGVRWLRDLNFGVAELKFLADCGFGAMAFFGAALVITATAQLFFSELENRTVHTLLAKPVRPSEFVVGKFLGLAALAGLFCVAVTALLVAVLWVREGQLRQDYADGFDVSGAISYVGIAVAGLMQWLKLAVLTALVLLVASFAQTQLFTVVVGFFVLVVCHLQYLGQEAAARGGGAAVLLGGALSSLFPNFQLFAPAESLAAADALPWMQVGRIALYGLGYMAAVCALTVFSFRRREL